MEHRGAVVEQLTAPGRIEGVVDVAAVEAAATTEHQLLIAEPAQVIRGQVLLEPEPVTELVDTQVAAGKCREDLPPDRVGGEPDKCRWRRIG